MAGEKYEWTFNGRGRTWTAQIIESGFAGSKATIRAGSEMKITWGRGTNSFDDRIRAAELMLEVIDPDLLVYNDLIDSTNEEEDFSILLTDSTSTYTVRMRIRLDEVSTLFVTGLEEQITKIYGYCGMGDLKTVDAVTLTSSSFHNLFRLILASNAIGQDIEYLVEHYPINVASSGALLDLVRLNRLDLIFTEGGRKVDTMYDQLKGVLEAFGLIALNGMDGQWHVKHEYGLGEVVAGRRGTAKYTHSSGLFTTLNTLTGNTFTLINALLDRGTLRRPVRPVQAVQMTRGNTRDFITVDHVRHGDFEQGWESATEHYDWTTVSGTYQRSTNSDTGTYALKFDDGSWQVRQKLNRFAGGFQEFDVEIALRYANESTAATTAKSGVSGLNVRYVNDTTVDATRGDPGGDWTTDPINGSIALNAAVVASGSSLVWTTVITTIYGPLPDYDGDLEIEFVGSITDYKLYTDTVEVRLKRGSSAKNKFVSVDGRYNLAGDLIGKGDVVEQSAAWYNGVLGLDPTDDGVRDSVEFMLEVITTPGGTSWVQASRFISEVSGFRVDEYDDLFELASDIRIARQTSAGEEIDGELIGIAPPDYVLTYDGINYTQVFTSIDLKTEVTSFVARKKLISTTAQSNPQTLYWGDSDGDIKKATIDPDNVPWGATTIASLTAGRSFITGHVDELAGFIFTLENISASSLNKIVRRNLDGTGATELLSWDSSSGNATGAQFNIARTSEIMAVVVTELPTAGNNFVIDKYDYDGNYVGRLITKTGLTKADGIVFHPDEGIIFWRESLGAGDRKLIRYVISTDTQTTLISNTTQDASGASNWLVMDPDLDRIWHSGSDSGTWLINYVDATTGGSETTYKDAGDGLGNTGRGLAYHRTQNRVIYPTTSNGDIAWDTDDGASDEQTVYDPGVGTHPDIKWLCTGYN